MKNINTQNQKSQLSGLNKLLTCFIILLLVSLFFSSSKVHTNPASARGEYKFPDTCIQEKVYEDELDYSFNVSDKLSGNGEVKLLLSSSKLKGTAVGIGKTDQCDVDFLTDFEGDLNSKDGVITVSVKGEGDPKGIPLPGKIAFNGPLKGYLKDKKLNLVGKVQIKGKLARYAGFKKEEDLVIEIDTTKLVPAARKKMQSFEKLASL